jgi:hypothetical protein
MKPISRTLQDLRKGKGGMKKIHNKDRQCSFHQAAYYKKLHQVQVNWPDMQNALELRELHANVSYKEITWKS